MENVIGSVRSGEVFNTYDFVDVINRNQKEDVCAYNIAKQCGTSEAMIDQFYDHVRLNRPGIVGG